ncbi:MAG TPA: hypothetical protein VG433_10950 [Pirellulales bacterium]|nr:hypothetical protein [Pirellulales bacterium]
MNCSKSWLPGVLLGFWTLWFAVVAASNLADLARSFGWLPNGWRFASGNYALLEKTTAIYWLPGWANLVLFLGVIAWEVAATWLLARSLAAACRGGLSARPLDRAFAVSAGLFAAFVLADELLIAFATGLEATHLRILMALLVTLFVVRPAADA